MIIATRGSIHLLLRLSGHLAGQRLRVDCLTLHLQSVFGCGSRRQQDGQYHIGKDGAQVHDSDMEHFEEPEQRDANQDKTDAPPSAVAAEIVGKTSQHASYHLVLHVPIEPLRSRMVHAGLSISVGIHLLVANLLRRTNPLDDFLHVFYGNGLHALCLLFREQFGNAGLDVVEYLRPILLLAEVVAQQIVGVSDQRCPERGERPAFTGRKHQPQCFSLESVGKRNQVVALRNKSVTYKKGSTVGIKQGVVEINIQNGLFAVYLQRGGRKQRERQPGSFL